MYTFGRQGIAERRSGRVVTPPVGQDIVRRGSPERGFGGGVHFVREYRGSGRNVPPPPNPASSRPGAGARGARRAPAAGQQQVADLPGEPVRHLRPVEAPAPVATVVPGVFIRWWPSRPRKSCQGIMAVLALDDMACRISIQGMASSGLPKYAYTRSRWPRRGC